MSSSDRRPHETATVLNQQLLDYSHDNLETKLQIIAEIESDQREEPRVTCTETLGSPGVMTAVNHGFIDDQFIMFETTGVLPTPLTAEIPYIAKNCTANTFEVTSSFVDPSIAFTAPGSGVHQASSWIALIRVSDRNIFVGKRFYLARTNFPVITRTLGEWLRPEIEFSSLELVLNNVDGRYNGLLPSGSSFSGFINKKINIFIGLRDVASTYFNVFEGYITEIGGFKRDIDKIRFVARDKFDILNVNFPTSVFTEAEYPKIKADQIGKGIPVIYGDYTDSVDSQGNIPSFLVNAGDPQITRENELPVTIVNGSPSVFQIDAHKLDDGDRIRFTTDGTLPTPLSDSTDYYVVLSDTNSFELSTSPGGASINTSGGSGQHNVVPQDLVNVQCVIAENQLHEFKSDDIWMLRGDFYHRISPSDVLNIDPDNNYFEIAQDTGNTLIDGDNFLYTDGDIFLVKVKGKTLGGGSYNDNIIEQAKDLILTFSGMTSTDFDASWATYRAKSSPVESAVASIKSRIWVQEATNLLQYALSLMEQVRLEFAISRDLTIKIISLHMDDWPASPSFLVRNFDVEEGSTRVSIDDKNNFNRLAGFYDFHPHLGENNKKTSVFRNQAAIDQAGGKLISKSLEFPNLYSQEVVNRQVQQILRLASASAEFLEITLTTRALLLDVGDFVKMDVKIGSTIWNNVPMMVRELGYDPDLKIPAKLWSFQMVPFKNPGGWNPGFAGIVGGDLATITEE